MNKILRILIYTLLSIIFFLGGLGIDNTTILYQSVILGLSILGFAYWKNGKIRLPRSVYLYGAFLLFFLLSLLWVVWRDNVWQKFLLFLSGGIFWLGTYNLGKDFGKTFLKIFLALGIAFGSLFVIYRIVSSPMSFRPDTLYLPTGKATLHNHLGDLWALVILTIGYLYSLRKKWWHFPLILLGIYFLAVSFSRSAYLALFAGFAFMFFKLEWFDKYKKTFTIVTILTVTLFLYVGFFKTTIFARPYFEQGFRGLIKHPFGVGIGNFSEVSTDPEISHGAIETFSSLAHNIVLEVITGIGYLSFTFVVWLFLVLKELIKRKHSEGVLFTALFLSLTTNFFFDATYFIPTMLWLWFVFLGIAQSTDEELENR